MGSGVRQGFPWETGGTRKVEHDLEPRPEVKRPDMRQAEAMASKVDGADPDPNRGRRGSRGTAARIWHEQQRTGQTTYRSEAEVRERVNAARTRVAAKNR